MAIDERRVDAGGITLSIREHPGSGPPILALHGLASNARWWDLVAERLPERVISIDLRGHGRSDKPADGYDVATVAADVAALAETLDVGRCVVAGHSWGASVALQLAGHLAEQCVGCVVVDGGVGHLRAHFGNSWSEAEEQMRPPQMIGLTEEMIRTFAGGGALGEGSDPETAADILLGNFESEGNGTVHPRLRLDHHMEIARDLFHLDSPALLARTRCPVLMIPARNPGSHLPEKKQAVHDALDLLGERGSVVWIDGGHDLPVQHPSQVAAAIRHFIGSLTSIQQETT